MPHQSMINFFAKKKISTFNSNFILKYGKTILCMLAQYVDFLPPVSRTGRIQTDARKLDQSVFRQRNLVHVSFTFERAVSWNCILLDSPRKRIILASSSNFGLKVDFFFLYDLRLLFSFFIYLSASFILICL